METHLGRKQRSAACSMTARLVARSRGSSGVVFNPPIICAGVLVRCFVVLNVDAVNRGLY
jgi:hypothetical protein